MGMWGARPKAAEAQPGHTTELPAGRLEQLMTFVERASVPAPPVTAPEAGPRLAPSPGYTEPARLEVVEAEPAPVPVAPAPVAEASLVAFPEPLLFAPSAEGGKRRRLLAQSA